MGKGGLIKYIYLLCVTLIRLNLLYVRLVWTGVLLEEDDEEECKEDYTTTKLLILILLLLEVPGPVAKCEVSEIWIKL